MARRTLIGVGYLAFTCRMLIPAGYMPTAWGEGGPITLCPMGAPSSLLSQNSDHDHHGSEDSPSHDLLWENCPLGALADTATFIPSFNFFIPQLQFTSKTAVAHASSSSSFFLGFKSRAPPFLRHLS